ncbi:hypothetical protein FRC01_011391, partial [Tulasnella sp. 417]
PPATAPEDVAEPQAAAERPTAEKNVSLTERLQWQHHPLTDGSKPLIPKEAGYNPYFAHSPHEECAMALVNRRPYGSPNHSDWLTPQDVAWLAGVKHAQKRVFIQTPDFNAKPIVEAVLDAARRGVECVLYICVGYNDAGEALPFQGGTNEEVVKNMYTALEDEYKHNLRVHWYTAIDQDRPINASLKKRNCHIKLMIIDDAVGIQGNGNQDAQSWYHSQEVNVMIDSPLICKEWVEGLRRSQNTHLYGEVQKDGVWRDKDGTPLPDSTGIKSGPMGLIKGIQGTIARKLQYRMSVTAIVAAGCVSVICSAWLPIWWTRHWGANGFDSCPQLCTCRFDCGWAAETYDEVHALTLERRNRPSKSARKDAGLSDDHVLDAADMGDPTADLVTEQEHYRKAAGMFIVRRDGTVEKTMNDQEIERRRNNIEHLEVRDELQEGRPGMGSRRTTRQETWSRVPSSSRGSGIAVQPRQDVKQEEARGSMASEPASISKQPLRHD